MSESLYRGLSRSEIDSQLNLRARWPEHAEFFARWARDSAQVRARLGGGHDLAYGDTAGQRLDLFPAPGGGAPLLAFVHGGYWQSLDKGEFSYLAPAVVDEGIAFASLNHDLAPAIGIAEMVGQIRRAVLWLARHGAAHGADPERIFIAGHSAGGHLALMTLGDTRVKGGCSISGIYELEPLRLSYHQEILGLDQETVQTMSPLRNLPARAGPLICAVGSIETEEFLRQQQELVAAWGSAGLDARVVDLPGRQHFSAVDALGEPDHPLFQAVREMVLGRYESATGPGRAP